MAQTKTNKLKTVNIKGKDYVMVNERIKELKRLYPDYSIVTEIEHLEDKMCVIKATILDAEGNPKATGHAYEREGSTPINRTSFIENAETSAVGRAIGFMNIGIDTSICSAEELAIAISQQETPEQIAERKLNGEAVELPTGEDFAKAMKSASSQQITMIKTICERIGQPMDNICKKYKVKGLDDLTPEQATEIIDKLKEAKK